MTYTTREGVPVVGIGRAGPHGDLLRAAHPTIRALDMPVDNRLKVDKALTRRLRHLKLAPYLSFLLLKLKQLNLQCSVCAADMPAMSRAKSRTYSTRPAILLPNDAGRR
ncbi:hypothetical protein [Devosia sp.]|uniref:hypothetical protein n=1 Tax=Devosia sp. TaxID=1871048 RepID=UPI0035B0E0A7